jgi:SAM-dependent methyltransferase
MSGRDITWVYGESDPALMLFTAAVQRWGLTWPNERPRILELGCAETNFLERLKAQNQDVELTGVDQRWDRDANGWTQVVASAIDPELFAPESFDVVVLLGALEHFGLGFYGDPLDDDGDIQTMRNVARWLRPGGWVYFDVPCNPTFSIAENRHFRTYAPASVTERLIVPGLVERVRGYSDCEPRAGTWLEGPPDSHQFPYWFVAVVADKPA